MKDIVKYNIIFFNLFPIIIESIIIIVGSIVFQSPIFLLSFIFIFIECKNLRKNLDNLRKVQNKFDCVGEVLYQNSECFLYDSCIINIKFNIFTVDYSDIDEIYFEKEYYGNVREPNICIITKDRKKYKIKFPRLTVPQPNDEELNLIIGIIKKNNPKVKLTGNTIKKYIEPDLFN